MFGAGLLVFEGFDGIELGGAIRREGAEEHADEDRSAERDQGGPAGDGDLVGGEETDGERNCKTEHSANEAARERKKHSLSEELETNLLAGCAECFADADLADASLNVGQHGVHDADTGDD